MRDKAVYRAVRAAIVAAHQEDGVTVADIVGETEEQKQAGRIKYLVVAEDRGICRKKPCFPPILGLLFPHSYCRHIVHISSNIV